MPVRTESHDDISAITITDKQRMIELARGAAWLVGIAVGLRVIDAFLGSSALAVVLVGAVFVDVTTSRYGVSWDAPPTVGAPGKSARVVFRQIGIGAGVFAAVVVGALLVGVVTREAHVALGKPSLNLGLGLIRASAIGVRDELLLRGLPLAAAARARIPERWALAFAALTGAAAIAMIPGTTLAAIAVASISGLLLAALWIRCSSAWPAIAGHAAWLLLTGPILRGDVLEVSWNRGALAAGSRAAGPSAWIAAAGFAIAATVVLRSSRRTA